MNDFLHLTGEHLEALRIPPGRIADAVEAAVAAQSSGTLLTAPKATVLPGNARYMMATLAVGADPALTVVKTVTVSPDNPERGLPTSNGAVLVLDAETGLLRALVDANWITAVRTAALSLVAGRRLADPQSRDIAFIGAGVQASSHLAAFADEFPLKRVHIYSRGAENARRLAAEAEGIELAASIYDTAEAALRAADIVVTSVILDYSIEPFLDAGWLKPTAFAAITDLGIPWHDASLSAFRPLVIDDHTQEAQSERKLAPDELVTHDLAELLTSPEIECDPDRPAAFVFRGVAVGDWAAAALALRVAEESGAGRIISSDR